MHVCLNKIDIYKFKRKLEFMLHGVSWTNVVAGKLEERMKQVSTIFLHEYLKSNWIVIFSTICLILWNSYFFSNSACFMCFWVLTAAEARPRENERERGREREREREKERERTTLEVPEQQRSTHHRSRSVSPHRESESRARSRPANVPMQR